MKFVLLSGSARELGGKAHVLARLSDKGFPIPAWFAISPAAFEQSVNGSQRAAIEGGNVDEIRAALRELAPDPVVLAEIADALQRLPSNGHFAVRSSAVDEDSAEHSFAGQLDSYLFVPAAAISERVADVWRSGFNERVLEYRRHQQAPLSPKAAPAVIIQCMVCADAAGVAFSADPVSGRRGVAVVSAVFGLGTALVSGESDADVYEVDRTGKVLRVSIAIKKTKCCYDLGSTGGVSACEVPKEQQNSRVLSNEQACAIAAMAREVECCFGRPQDIEWALESGKLYLLQARPITTLRHLADPDAQLCIWDNSNICESYSGVTTPLTFSFARAAYEGVYREFYRQLAVPQSAINSHAQSFRNMLGLIRGRVYYNLLNWYRVLTLLPGYKDNRTFLEQMLGVKHVTANEAKPTPEKSLGQRVLRAWHFARALAATLWNYMMLSRRTKNFYARLNDVLEPTPAYDIMRADELARHYCDLESNLVVHWNAPALNDFFVMIFHGWLRRLSQRWLDGGDELANNLVRASGAMISKEPAVQLSALAAEIAARHPTLIQHLCGSEPAEAIPALRQVPEVCDKYDQYLAKFGDRCLEELKLESSTLHDDPAPLLRRLGELAQAKTAARASSPVEHDSPTAAMQEADRILRGRPLRRLIFHWVLRNSRRFICLRENLRFERTRVFGRVRRIFVEIGRRFHESDLLEDPRDVFYLQVEEILAFMHGTAVTANLKPLVAIRKQEFDEFRNQPAPADRFETRGPVYQGNSFQSMAPTQEPTAPAEERRGLGSCPGRVRAEVCVITNPREDSITPGRILVAERTDPGWIMLFPGAAGLIVERGSLLSHSAIVSRELGIPCVVSVAGATQWLHNGDVVELDGGKGVVRRIGKPPTMCIQSPPRSNAGRQAGVRPHYTGYTPPATAGSHLRGSSPAIDRTCFRDRLTGEILVERVFGEKALNRLYRTAVGRLAMDLLLCRSLPTSVYGWLQRRPSSRGKIPGFVRALGIDVTEAELSIDAYRSLDEFFVRRLKPGARPIDPDPEHFVSPSDGRVQVYSRINHDLQLNIKRSRLSVAELLGDTHLAQYYAGGAVIALRLAPADYHRFHFPDDGVASPSVLVNGPLHSVHPIALAAGSPTFRNKRCITRLETRAWGVLALVEIGALCVGTIEQTYKPGPVRRGQEKGFFHFGGSSIVVLAPQGRLRFDSDLIAASADDMETYVKMGTKLGQRSIEAESGSERQ